MRNNFLNLHDSKIEMLVNGSRRQVAKVQMSGVVVADALITPFFPVFEI